MSEELSTRRFRDAAADRAETNKEETRRARARTLPDTTQKRKERGTEKGAGNMLLILFFQKCAVGCVKREIVRGRAAALVQTDVAAAAVVGPVHALRTLSMACLTSLMSTCGCIVVLASAFVCA